MRSTEQLFDARQKCIEESLLEQYRERLKAREHDVARLEAEIARVTQERDAALEHGAELKAQGQTDYQEEREELTGHAAVRDASLASEIANSAASLSKAPSHNGTDKASIHLQEVVKQASQIAHLERVVQVRNEDAERNLKLVAKARKLVQVVPILVLPEKSN